MLVTSNFSISHYVFHSYISLVGQNAVLCCNGLKCIRLMSWNKEVVKSAFSLSILLSQYIWYCEHFFNKWSIQIEMKCMFCFWRDTHISLYLWFLFFLCKCIVHVIVRSIDCLIFYPRTTLNFFSRMIFSWTPDKPCQADFNPLPHNATFWCSKDI